MMENKISFRHMPKALKKNPNSPCYTFKVDYLSQCWYPWISASLRSWGTQEKASLLIDEKS